MKVDVQEKVEQTEVIPYIDHSVKPNAEQLEEYLSSFPSTDFEKIVRKIRSNRRKKEEESLQRYLFNSHSPFLKYVSHFQGDTMAKGEIKGEDKKQGAFELLEQINFLSPPQYEFLTKMLDKASIVESKYLSLHFQKKGDEYICRKCNLELICDANAPLIVDASKLSKIMPRQDIYISCLGGNVLVGLYLVEEQK